MKTFSLATLFLPEWALPWVAVIGVAAWILGARVLGVAAALLLLTELLLAPLLAPWIATLPTWGLLMLAAALVIVVLHQVIDLLFGKETAGHVTGTYVVRLLDVILLGPIRLLARLLRRL